MAAEKNFENALKRYLKSIGAWYIKYWAGGGYTRAGVPDLLTCIHGRFIGIEVKGPAGRPSELQLHTIKEIREAGGMALILYPSGFDQFKKWIENGMETELPEVMK